MALVQTEQPRKPKLLRNPTPSDATISEALRDMIRYLGRSIRSDAERDTIRQQCMTALREHTEAVDKRRRAK